MCACTSGEVGGKDFEELIDIKRQGGNKDKPRAQSKQFSKLHTGEEQKINTLSCLLYLAALGKVIGK